MLSTIKLGISMLYSTFYSTNKKFLKCGYLLKEIYITVLIVCIIIYGLYHVQERISITNALG